MFEFLIKQNYFKLSSSFQSFNPVIFLLFLFLVVDIVTEVVQNIFFDLFMVERVIWKKETKKERTEKKSFCMSAWYVFS